MNILEQAGIRLVDELDRSGDFCRLRVFETSINGLMIFEKGIRRDERGEFSEIRMPDVRRYTGVNFQGEQSNVSKSRYRVVRGEHAEDQDKLVGPDTGEIIAAWVDTRTNSSTFGVVQRFVGMDHRFRAFIPEGVANGFGVISKEDVLYSYSTSEIYPSLSPALQVAINPMSAFRGYPNGLFYEIEDPIISKRDGRDAISWDQFVLQVRATRNEKR